MTTGKKSGPWESNTEMFTSPRNVWVFQCEKRLALHAASLDQTGESVPSTACRDGRWILIGQMTVGPDDGPRIGVDVVALKTGIQNDGFYLWNADEEPWPPNVRLIRL